MLNLKLTISLSQKVLRVYLYQAGVDYAVWRREHPSKPLIMKIESKDKAVSKVVAEAANLIKKDCAQILALIKK